MKNTKKQSEVKRIPKFKSEDEERNFWDEHDTTEYFDVSKAFRAKLPNLKYSTETISIRLPLSLLENVKAIANKKDVPYQSLIKIYLAEKVGEESKKYHG